MKIKDFDAIKKIVGDFDIIDNITYVEFNFKEEISIQKLKLFYKWCYNNIPIICGIKTNKDDILSYSSVVKEELINLKTNIEE